jgi:hypothetical protein
MVSMINHELLPDFKQNPEKWEDKEYWPKERSKKVNVAMLREELLKHFI